MTRFTNKVVLISGTGGGQGRAAALAFAREGARVIGCDVAEDRSVETTRLVREARGEMRSLEPLDLADPIQAGRWVEEAMTQWGQIDVLYNNAAGIAIAPFDSATIEHWEFTLRNELTIGFVAAKAAWPHFVKQKRGVIINTASLAAHLELSQFPCVAHGVANAGILAMTRMLAAAGAPHGIRAVSISPGPVLNRTVPPPYNDPASAEMRALCAPVPLGRPAEIQEIISTALFLASDEASYITGTDVAVDGGASGIVWR